MSDKLGLPESTKNIDSSASFKVFTAVKIHMKFF
jgi:hypothetical protein